MKHASLIRFRIDFTESSNLGPGKIALLEGIRTYRSAGEFLQSVPSCRLLPCPRALNRLLHEFFDAHESVLSVARPNDSTDEHFWVHDFAVGQVVLTNEQQCESINGVLLKNEPPLRFRQTDF